MSFSFYLQLELRQEQLQQQQRISSSASSDVVSTPLKRQREDEEDLLLDNDPDLFDDLGFFAGSFGSSSEDDHDFGSFVRETTSKVRVQRN